MSIFDRLYHILRANMRAARDTVLGDNRQSGGRQSGGRQSGGRQSDDDDWSSSWSSSSGSSSSYGSSGSSSGGSSSGPDPKIAQFYANLELPYGADLQAVKQARKRLLRKYHPDRFHGRDEDSRTAQELTQEINRAHDELVTWLKSRGTA